MILYRFLNSLGLDADVSLRGSRTTVLQQPLDQRNIITVGLVDFRRVPFAETVGADTLEAQVIAHNPQLLLNCSLCDREHQLCAPDTVPQTIVFDIPRNPADDD